MRFSQGNGPDFAARNGVARPAPPFAKVQLYNLFTDKAAPTGGSTSVIYVEIETPEITELGPYLEQINIYTNTVGRTTNHSWNVTFQWSNDMKNWYPATPANLFTAITMAGPSVPTPYSTIANFGLGMRYALATSNSTGSALESAVVSCTIGLQFKT